MKKYICLIAAAMCLSLLPVAGAYAVFISPVFVMFDRNETTKSITLNNRSSTAKVITLEWERRAWEPGGKSVILQPGESVPGYRPADELVKFSPRRMIIKPKDYQVIRLIAQRGKDLAPGEYRSHLLIKEEDLVKKTQDDTLLEKGVSGEVVLTVNKSIPVFLRQGETTVSMSLQKAALSKTAKGDAIDVVLSNASTRSLYANLHLVCKQGDGLLQWNIGPMRAFSERTSITQTLLIPDSASDALSCPALTAEVRAVNDILLNGQVVAEAPVTR